MRYLNAGCIHLGLQPDFFRHPDRRFPDIRWSGAFAVLPAVAAAAQLGRQVSHSRREGFSKSPASMNGVGPGAVPGRQSLETGRNHKGLPRRGLGGWPRLGGASVSEVHRRRPRSAGPLARTEIRGVPSSRGARTSSDDRWLQCSSAGNAPMPGVTVVPGIGAATAESRLQRNEPSPKLYAANHPHGLSVSYLFSSPRGPRQYPPQPGQIIGKGGVRGLHTQGPREIVIAIFPAAVGGARGSIRAGCLSPKDGPSLRGLVLYLKRSQTSVVCCRNARPAASRAQSHSGPP